MKRFFTIIIALLTTYITIGSWGDKVPPPMSTGAPGEGTCATGAGCHTATNNSKFSPQSPLLTVTFGGGVTKYKNDSVYDITLTTTKDANSPNAYGFQGVCKDSTGKITGSFIASTLQAVTNGYISHSGTTLSNVSNFKWKAPSKDSSTRDVTFYFISNMAHSNAINNIPDANNDSVRTKSFKITFDTTNPVKQPGVGIRTFEYQSFSINPSFVSNSINISSEMLNRDFKIFNTNGVLVKSGKINSNNVDATLLKSGLYYMIVDDKLAKFIKE